VGRLIRAGVPPREIEIAEFMRSIMREHHLHFEDGPIVGINEHAGDPHFEPTEENSLTMKEGDILLLDLWGKMDRPGSIYADITWMGYIGKSVPAALEEIFQVIRRGRDAAVALVRERFAAGVTVYGWEVDDACRKVIVDAGYGAFFTHRTGHNIGEEVHGNGVHIDNLETKDERTIIPGSCFSVEPGIYMPEKKLGFRTEIDVVVTDEGEVTVEGGLQERIVPILA